MATEKKEPTTKSLQEQLDAITFKNAQAEKIKSIQEGKERLKDNLGRNRKQYQAAVGRVQGLQGLQGMGNTLGNQFKKTKS
jgi:hypothetical protein